MPRNKRRTGHPSNSRIPYVKPAIVNSAIKEKGKSTLISDSICKKLGDFFSLTVQAYPGATAAKLLKRLPELDLKFELIIVHVGTNDLDNQQKQLSLSLETRLTNIVDGILVLLRTIRDTVGPNPKIAWSCPIPRPCTEGPASCLDTLSGRRASFHILLNKVGSIRAQAEGFLVVNASPKFLKAQAPNLSLFAKDGLHLSLEGEDVLWNFFRGKAGSLAGQNR